MRPLYLLLDEPTAGLDAVGRTAVVSAIEAARGRTGIVVVSHDVDEFLGIADSVLILADGKPEYSGPAARLLEDVEPLTRAGLGVPGVLAVLHAAKDRGMPIEGYTLDAARAAAQLVSGACR
jgi:energy-coupling factor transport system ATP-binding protein